MSPATVDRAGNLTFNAASAIAASFILVSVVGAAPDSPMGLFRAKFSAEEHLRRSPCRRTIVRPTDNLTFNQLASKAELLSAADAPLAVVRDQCLQAKAVDRDAAHARIRAGRYAREFTDGEGAWNFRARGTPEDGARFRHALDPIVDEMFRTARAEDRKETREAYAFDAFIELANRTSGDGTTKKPPARFMALIRADIEALQRGTVEGDEICEIDGLGPIPAMVARKLLGDAILKLVITKGVDVANPNMRVRHHSSASCSFT